MLTLSIQTRGLATAALVLGWAIALAIMPALAMLALTELIAAHEVAEIAALTH